MNEKASVFRETVGFNGNMDGISAKEQRKYVSQKQD